MAELHITGVDEEVLAQLRRRAEREGRSTEALIREELKQAASRRSPAQTAEEDSFVQAVDQIQSTPAEERIPDVEPVEIEGIPASELLIRDRRRR
jgi:plasmid stability protein